MPAAALVLLVAAGGALPVGAQEARPEGRGSGGDAVGAATEAVLAERASRAAGRATVASDPVERRRWSEEAERYARALLHVDPRSPDGHHLLAAAHALRIATVGTREKIALGVSAHREARAALEADPDHPGAHHVIGRLHAEVMTMSWLERFVASRIGLGEVVDDASWASAERHLARARTGEPGSVRHLLHLARAHLAQDEDEEARPLLREAVSLPADDPVEAHHRSEARELLDGLREEAGSGEGSG